MHLHKGEATVFTEDPRIAIGLAPLVSGLAVHIIEDDHLVNQRSCTESDIVPGVIIAQAFEVSVEGGGFLTTGRLLDSRGLRRGHLGCWRGLCRALCRALPRPGLLPRDGDHSLPWRQGRLRLGSKLQRAGLQRGSTWRRLLL